MENFKRIESIRIGLASSEQIRRWAERKLSNGRIIGQVTNPQTVNYKTLRPEPGGLFCEKIFGPIKDFECACGKKRNLMTQKFCPECEVDFVSARVRRYRLGYIELAAPVAHIWYLKGTPSYLSILLDMPRKKVESIIYCTESISFNDFNFLTLDEEINPADEDKPKSFFNDNEFKEITKTNDSSERFIRETNLSMNHRSEFNNMNESYHNFFNGLGTKKISTFPYLFKSSIKKTDNFLSFMGISKKFVWESYEEEGLFRYYATSSSSEDDPLIHNYSLFPNFFPIKKSNFLQSPVTGAHAILNLLKMIDLDGLERQINHEIFEMQEEIEQIYDLQNQFSFEEKRLQYLLVRRGRMLKRLKLIRQFRRTKTSPEWLILSNLPVLPPDLRPIVQLDSDQVAVSDLNKLYQKVLFRNNRMKRHQRAYHLMNQSDELKYAQRLLQEAVDSLIENGKGGTDPITASNERPLKSLSDMLKGKKGRFRQNLLGKRVDYSGRSVIVVGPHLQLHECGLPKEMAIELFQPFLIHTLISTNVVRTILGAKHLITKQDKKVWKCLEKVLADHPVLLNRAPTLHRLGIQAFQPKLVPGRAIHLHPLVCPAFNADFDGDQMAVHVPLSYEARAESWNLMWSRNNLLSPATGQPILVPSQDMVLGCYYLTTLIPEDNLLKKNQFDLYFSNSQQILHLYSIGKLYSQSIVWYKLSKNEIETDLGSEPPIEIHVMQDGKFLGIYPDRVLIFSSNLQILEIYIRTTPGRIFFNDILQKTILHS